MKSSLNIFGEELIECSVNPNTGYFRDGCCNTDDSDLGIHTVCIITTEAFLEFSKKAGNDLSTPYPEYSFPGLKPGDQWCLCAARFLEAHNNESAPKIVLEATHERTLDVIPMDLLLKYAFRKDIQE